MMGVACTRCEGTGFLNVHQLPKDIAAKLDAGDVDAVTCWMFRKDDHDVQICDCCGDGDGSWWSEPGEHDYSVQPVFDCM